jgi:hypothetical protein
MAVKTGLPAPMLKAADRSAAGQASRAIRVNNASRAPPVRQPRATSRVQGARTTVNVATTTAHAVIAVGTVLLTVDTADGACIRAPAAAEADRGASASGR